MITTIPDRERALRAQVDALTAELARLRSQEPVAWYDDDMDCAYTASELDGGTADGLAPLYRAAPPAQPAEPVQRLSDERAAFEAWHNEYRTQELVRRDDTYYNTHARCRWEGWQARAIESALQPGWRPEWPAFVEYWTHESHLQTFADRERFRAAAKAMLEAAPKATK